MLADEVIDKATNTNFSSSDSTKICDTLLQGLSQEQIQAASRRRHNDTV
jgi:hypothetical protein